MKGRILHTVSGSGPDTYSDTCPDVRPGSGDEIEFLGSESGGDSCIDVYSVAGRTVVVASPKYGSAKPVSAVAL